MTVEYVKVECLKQVGSQRYKRRLVVAGMQLVLVHSQSTQVGLEVGKGVADVLVSPIIVVAVCTTVPCVVCTTVQLED